MFLYISQGIVASFVGMKVCMGREGPDAHVVSGFVT